MVAMSAAIPWERPSATVGGERSQAAVLLRSACKMLLKTSPETITAMTLTLPVDGQLTSSQLMDMALDMAAANGLIAVVADRTNHVDVRLTRLYRSLIGESR